MKLNRILVVGLLLSLFVGLASATEDDDIIDTFNTISDTKDALDIANEGNDILQRQLDDPTNETLLAENLEELMKKPIETFTGDLDNFDPDEFGNRMIGIIILIFAIKIFGLILAVGGLR